MNIKRADAEERAYRGILHLLSSQRYAPGDRLVEMKLAEELGLSRTPVRNALRQLVACGVLEQHRNQGCNIPKLTPEDMQNVFQTRILLEGRAAAVTAKRATQREIERLQELLEEERMLYAAGEHEPYTAVNESIHLGIADLTRNDYLQRFISQAFWRSELYVFFFDRFYIKEGGAERPTRDPDASQSCREHAALFNAIASRDSKAAETAMCEHINSTLVTLSNRVWLY